MEALKATLLHTLELAVVLGAGLAVVKLLDLDGESTAAVIALILGALAKFTRASDTIPVKDYVNE